MTKELCKAIPVTQGPCSHFFGYYDKCPWDAADNRILCHETAFDRRMPNREDRARIGWISMERLGHFVAVSDTGAWNWQQGAMLQWLGPGFDRQIIFNDRFGYRSNAVVQDLPSGERILCPGPICAVHPNGQWGISLNFGRLARLRPGYGYAGLDDPTEGQDLPDNDGLFAIDFRRKDLQLLVSTRSVALLGVTTAPEGHHWLDHVIFSPNGDWYSFLHRWIGPGGALFSRLFVASIQNHKPQLLLDTGMASHSGWKDSLNLCIWARRLGVASRLHRNSDLSRLLMPLVRFISGSATALLGHRWRRNVLGDGFQLINIVTGHGRTLPPDLLEEDGHCTWSRDGTKLLTDTYPDRMGEQRVLLYDDVTHKKQILARLPSPPRFAGPCRCDLHPRMSRKEDLIAIDSTHGGSRQLYFLPFRNNTVSPQQ